MALTQLYRAINKADICVKGESLHTQCLRCWSSSSQDTGVKWCREYNVELNKLKFNFCRNGIVPPSAFGKCLKSKEAHGFYFIF